GRHQVLGDRGPDQEGGFRYRSGHQAGQARPVGAAQGPEERQGEQRQVAAHDRARGRDGGAAVRKLACLRRIRSDSTRCPKTAGPWRRVPAADYFFFGAIIMIICRPSRRGRDSMTTSSARSVSMRLAISRPSSWWALPPPLKPM